jgi:hypothetical protein
MGEWRYSSTHFSLDTRHRWVVIFMLRPFLPLLQLDTCLDGSQSWSRHNRLCWISNPARPARFRMWWSRPSGGTWDADCQISRRDVARFVWWRFYKSEVHETSLRNEPANVLTPVSMFRVRFILHFLLVPSLSPQLNFHAVAFSVCFRRDFACLGSTELSHRICTPL